MRVQDILEVLDKTPSSNEVHQLCHICGFEPVRLEYKEMGGVLYASVKDVGISFQFERSSARSNDQIDDWKCKAIDLFNSPYGKGWQTFIGLPFELNKCCATHPSSQDLRFSADTLGKEIVNALGEPDRKGGGETLKGGGASGFGPGAFMEYKQVKVYLDQGDITGSKDPSSLTTNHYRMVDLLVELAGQEARGAHRWEKSKGGSAPWGVITFSLPES